MFTSKHFCSTNPVRPFLIKITERIVQKTAVIARKILSRNIACCVLCLLSMVVNRSAFLKMKDKSKIIKYPSFTFVLLQAGHLTACSVCNETAWTRHSHLEAGHTRRETGRRSKLRMTAMTVRAYPMIRTETRNRPDSGNGAADNVHTPAPVSAGRVPRVGRLTFQEKRLPV